MVDKSAYVLSLLVSVPDAGAALVDEGSIPVGLPKPTMVALCGWFGHPKGLTKNLKKYIIILI
jgi:hypothetical protein